MEKNIIKELKILVLESDIVISDKKFWLNYIEKENNDDFRLKKLYNILKNHKIKIEELNKNCVQFK